MEISLSTQTALFLYSVVAGAVISVIYDVFRIFRIAIPHAAAVTLIEDLLFCACTFCVVNGFNMLFNNGVFRAYVGIGMVLGFVLCRFTVSALIILQAKIIIKIVKAVLRIILFPFRLIMRFVCKLFSLVAVFLKKVFIFLKKHCNILVRRTVPGSKSKGENRG